MNKCINDFTVAIPYVKLALTGLKDGRYDVLKSNINATQLYYDACDYRYRNNGKTNPIAKSTRHLKDIANVATAVILFTDHSHGAGLCDNSPNKQVCYSIVRTDPHDASVAACHKLVYETKVAKMVAQRQPKSLEMDKCINAFTNAIPYVKLALTGLKDGRYDILKSNINATQVYYDACDYVYTNYGKTNPIAKSTKLLKGHC
nr:hypothetical protein CFP56_61451 [Quercus suber]